MDEQLSATSRKHSTKNHHFPCLQCGSQLNYQPGTLSMQCEHCGSEHRIQVSHDPILEYDYHATLAQLPAASPHSVHKVLQCQACGAQTEVDTTLHADECPFCGTDFVLEGQEQHIIQPKSLLPFAISDDEAKAQYKAWVKRLWFAPSSVWKYAKQDQQLNGVYVPYWTYDCRAHTEYVGERGVVHYVRRRVRVQINGRWTTQVRRVPEVHWTPVRGQVSGPYDDTLVYASNTLERELSRELAPWDLNNIRPYQEEFVSGFRSEVYQTDLDDGFSIAQQRIRPYITQAVLRDIGGDQQRIHKISTRYSDITFKHLLLPFWVAGFRFRRKTYQFIVNGRTGEVQGDRPWSWVKIGLAGLAGLAVLALLLFFVSMQSNGLSYSSSGNLFDLLSPQR